MPNLPVVIHLACAGVALVATGLTLSLKKGDARHRWLGRIAAFALIATAASSFAITRKDQFSPIHILSVITLINVPMAIAMIRRGNVRGHKIAMISNALGLFGAGLGAALVPGRFLHTIFFG